MRDVKSLDLYRSLDLGVSLTLLIGVVEFLPKLSGLSYQLFVSQIKRDLQVTAELDRKLRIHFKYLKQIVAVYFVQIAIGQCSNVTGRFANFVM